MTKRTKVVAPKVAIGDRTNPTPAGLQALADSTKRLVRAVQPHLQSANDTAATALLEFESEVEGADAGDVLSSAESGSVVGVPTTAAPPGDAD